MTDADKLEACGDGRVENAIYEAFERAIANGDDQTACELLQILASSGRVTLH